MNSVKTHLLVICKSGNGEELRRAAAKKRAYVIEVTLTARGELIVQSDSELLLGATQSL